MPKFKIKNVLVEEGASAHPLTSKILDALPDVPVVPAMEIDPISGTERLNRDKQTLYLFSYKGEFLKPCPGTKEYICCGYQILNVGTNCPLDCSYCILQSYFNQPFIRVFVNLREKLDAILQTIDCNPDIIFRIGTGEFTDSLAIDSITRWSDILLPEFSERKNVVLELKTKTAEIKGLLNSRYRDRIIVSWSLNSPFIAHREEHRASGLEARLEAARQCQSEGFTLGFHFDPLIIHTKWKEEYMRTIDLMDRYIDPKGIIWISLGALRFMPELKAIIRSRHPGTRVLDGEFIRGLDGKMRYFKPLRMELYSFMKENLKKWYQDTCLYLCMESDDVWQKSMGWSPRLSSGLCSYLDTRVVKIFG